MTKSSPCGLRPPKLSSAAIGALLLSCAHAAAPPDAAPRAASPAAEARPEAPSVERARVVVYYVSEEIVRTSHCEATVAVERRSEGAVASADGALSLLFAGPTDAERRRGLLSPFERSTNDPSAGPLSEYFLRAERDGRVVRLHFTGRAMAYLNAAACAQTSVKTAIERTLRALGGVEDVVYVVDGAVVTEWDA